MNVGDVLDRLTAGRFKSSYHRARNLSCERPRLSLPFFYDPAWDARMQTLPIPQAGSLVPHKDIPFTGFSEGQREEKGREQREVKGVIFSISTMNNQRLA